MKTNERTLVNLNIGDVVSIEHTVVDTRETITAIVSCACIRNGKGASVFHTDDGQVYVWKPSKEFPHGTVDRIDSPNEDYLVNPYVMVYNSERDLYIPVNSKSGTYLTYQ